MAHAPSRWTRECHRCGYDLLALDKPGAVCPECGEAVVELVRSDSVPRWADAAMLLSVLVDVVCLAIVAEAFHHLMMLRASVVDALALAFGLVAITGSFWAVGVWPRWWFNGRRVWLPSLALSAPLIFVVGVWLM